MPRKKVKKIAGMSFDDWFEEIPKRVPIKTEIKKYSHQLIAFLDILGIKQLIDNHKDGKEHYAIDMIDRIRKIVKTASELIEDYDKITYIHISDSFVFVCDPDEIILLLKLLSNIQMRIVNECKFLLRGAITIGDAIVQDEGTSIIGPAFIQAYQLQEHDAIYPRIIVDNSVINKIKLIGDKFNKYLLPDLDKEYFVNYIKVFMNYENKIEKDIKIMLRRENIFNWLSDNYKKYNDEEAHNICQKYGWTIQYYKKIGVWENDE